MPPLDVSDCAFAFAGLHVVPRYDLVSQDISVEFLARHNLSLTSPRPLVLANGLMLTGFRYCLVPCR